MELFDYAYDRFIISRPLILLRPFSEILDDFMTDIYIILAAFLFIFVTVCVGVYCYRKTMQIVLRDRETQTQKGKWDKGTQTYNYYQPSIKHTLTRRLIVLEETVSPDE